jgi:2-keto-4-pentenoate hydratase/2-oxohepta-3-ene-1,7-dioic acid hydratase in catechol pathway
VDEVAQRPGAVTHPVTGAHFLPPIIDPQKIICIGLNYRDHAAEQNIPVPREPVVFSKFVTALTGHGRPIELPSVSNKVDYEAELVVVVGQVGRYVAESDAADHVAGYMVGHDVSARDWQKEKDGKQWLCGKTFDTFAPTGPELITADEIQDPHNLPIRLRLNGQVMQESNTNQLIFSVPKLIAYVSQVFTLSPGDLIFTGTPPGVGDARKPPLYLKPGDVAEVEIEGLGVLRNPVVQGP